MMEARIATSTKSNRQQCSFAEYLGTDSEGGPPRTVAHRILRAVSVFLTESGLPLTERWLAERWREPVNLLASTKPFNF